MNPFHNYLQNHLIQKSIELQVPVQIHTGTFGGSNGGKLQNSNPVLLSGMLMEYPQARFDFLHSGFPYMKELGEMVREFPNLMVNVTWLQILSPRAFLDYIGSLRAVFFVVIFFYRSVLTALYPVLYPFSHQSHVRRQPFLNSLYTDFYDASNISHRHAFFCKRYSCLFFGLHLSRSKSFCNFLDPATLVLPKPHCRYLQRPYMWKSCIS